MKLRLVMAGLATSLAFSAAHATDLNKARYLAAACANCHGTNGNAVEGGFSLAGYPKDRFIDTMNAFKSGQRPATLMHQIAKGYTDEQIAIMGDFFAAQKKR
jgi:cytochrome subunit of sulfide dehydrogenase